MGQTDASLGSKQETRAGQTRTRPNKHDRAADAHCRKMTSAGNQGSPLVLIGEGGQCSGDGGGGARWSIRQRARKWLESESIDARQCGIAGGERDHGKGWLVSKISSMRTGVDLGSRPSRRGLPDTEKWLKQW